MRSRRSCRLVVIVIADQRFLNSVVIEQNARAPRIFASDEVGLLQNPDGAKSDVFEVSDRGTDQIKSPWHAL